MSQTLSKRDALNELYRRGNLSWRLDPFQKEVHSVLSKSEEKVMVLLCSRRLGKSYLAVALAVEQCLKKPGSIVKILSPTKLMVNTNIRPLLKEVLADCPENLKPNLVKSQFIYYFPNGSEIHLAGSDNGHAEKLRGSFADLCIVDEAGFCNDLMNIVRSILIPTTLNTKGKILLLSTPPKSPDHDFMKFVEDAEANGTLIKKTIYDNPRIKPEEINEMAKSYPNGIHDAEFKREFLCIMTKDLSTAVLPEFDEDLEKEIVKEHPTPPFYDTYVSMDLGGKDLTVVLFGYYDFRACKIIIQDEIVMDFSKKDNTLPKFCKMIEDKELELWKNPLTDEIKIPYLRVSDINYIVTQEITRASNNKIHFIPTKKDVKEMMINNLRVMLGSKKIIIHPRCKTLIRHLRHVKWQSANNQTKFARSSDDGHYDAVDALVYMVRNIVYSKNPYPNNYDRNMKDLYINNPDKFYNGKDNQLEIYKQIFNIKGKR